MNKKSILLAAIIVAVGAVQAMEKGRPESPGFDAEFDRQWNEHEEQMQQMKAALASQRDQFNRASKQEMSGNTAEIQQFEANFTARQQTFNAQFNQPVAPLCGQTSGYAGMRKQEEKMRQLWGPQQGNFPSMSMPGSSTTPSIDAQSLSEKERQQLAQAALLEQERLRAEQQRYTEQAMKNLEQLNKTN